MTTHALMAALAGVALVGGAVGLIRGLNSPPPPTRRRTRRSSVEARWQRLTARTRWLLVGGVLAGVAVAAVTGWILAIVVVPAAVVGIPVLLSPPAAVAQINRLVGLEEWTRALSGVLTAGVGLEQAITATLRSTPAAVKPEVALLVGRINARWSTETALRQFADDLGDNVGGVGDTIAATLILGARRRGGGLAPLMNDLAASVAEEVRAQRAIEADREKPRATARWVTIITISVLGFLALTGDYIAPYSTALGQLILTVLLSAYVATLVWMRRMARGEPAPRFIGVAASQGRSV